MRKIFACLLALMLLYTPAMAFEGTGYPPWDGAAPAKDAACGSFDGEQLYLEFDPAPDFSSAEGGIAQICFYAHSADQRHYLELYLILPTSLKAGDVISEANMMAEPCSITLYEVLPVGERAYFASQFYGMPYPEGSSFELKIDTAQSTQAGFSLRGSLNAVLMGIKNDVPTGKTIVLENIAFDFSLPADGSADGMNPSPFSGMPADPAPSIEAAPKFTLPPDHIRL